MYAVPVLREVGTQPLLSIAFKKIFLSAIFCLYFLFPGCDDQDRRDPDPTCAKSEAIGGSIRSLKVIQHPVLLY